jgi:hypothetical protein
VSPADDSWEALDAETEAALAAFRAALSFRRTAQGLGPPVPLDQRQTTRLPAQKRPTLVWDRKRQ